MEISIPAIKGEQAENIVLQTQFTFAQLVKFFQFVSEDLPIEDRHQRNLSEKRAKDFRDYLLDNNHKIKAFVVPTLTASLDLKPENLKFEQIHAEQPIGVLTFPLSTKLILNDGQHRRRGIEMALENEGFKEELENQSIGVMLLVDPGFKRAQQIFSDINGNAAKVSNSLNILFDSRSGEAHTTKQVVKKVPIFAKYTEKEKATITPASSKLFLYASLHKSIELMMDALQKVKENASANQGIIVKYWNAIAEIIPQWKDIRDRIITCKEVKTEFLSTHAVTIEALARVGASLCSQYLDNSDEIVNSLQSLADIDWSKNNPDWQGKIIIISSKGQPTVRNHNDTKSWLTGYLREKLGLTESVVEVETDEADISEPVAV